MQLSELDFNKTYSYADYLQWSFDERLELIKGKIFKMSPAPVSAHQKISWVISGELYNYLKDKSYAIYRKLTYGDVKARRISSLKFFRQVIIKKNCEINMRCMKNRA